MCMLRLVWAMKGRFRSVIGGEMEWRLKGYLSPGPDYKIWTVKYLLLDIP